jgi:EAL domain-containing protein (putative c-di-GMP-specific phosphodiesterase class I)
VESQEQRDFLHSQGCYAYQGYLFGRPLPVDEFDRQPGLLLLAADDA